MMFTTGFIYICFLSFILVCLYFGLKAAYVKIRDDGFIKFLEATFYVFVCVAVVYLLSVKVGETFFPGLTGSKYQKVIDSGFTTL